MATPPYKLPETYIIGQFKVTTSPMFRQEQKYWQFIGQDDHGRIRVSICQERFPDSIQVGQWVLIVGRTAFDRGRWFVQVMPEGFCMIVKTGREFHRLYDHMIQGMDRVLHEAQVAMQCQAALGESRGGR